MAPRRTVATSEAVFAVVDSSRLVHQALVVAVLRDGARDSPLAVSFVEALTPFTAAHLASDGSLAVTGRADLALAGLATAPQDVTVRLGLPGRPPATVTITVPQASALPFTPAPIVIDGPGVALAGTVTTGATPVTAVDGAVVVLSPPSATPSVAVLRTALRLDHPAGTTLALRSLSAAISTTAVDAPAAAGDVALRLASVTGAAGDVVLALGTVATREHVRIVTVDTPARVVTVDPPLRRPRADAEPVTLHTLTPGPTPAGSLLRDARAGEALVVVSTPVAGPLVEIGAELRELDAMTGPDGRWRIDGVRGFAQLDVSVAATGLLTCGPAAHVVDYDADPDLLDLTLSSP